MHHAQAFVFIHRAVGIVLLIAAPILFTACDEGTASCPSDGLPQELVGDWVRCDEDWNLRTDGMRIKKDGKRTGLGVEWSTGTIALAAQMCRPGSLACAGDHLVTRWLIPGGFDTLRYAISGDRLELTETRDPQQTTKYRKVSLGTKVEEPRSYSFTYTIDGSPSFGAPQVWPRIPVRNWFDPSANNRFHVQFDGPIFMYFTLDRYSGPGTYVLGAVSSGSWGEAVPNCTDAVQEFLTQDDSRSSVTIYTYDETDGHSLGAVDLHMTDRTGDTMHVTGMFKAVIGK